MSAVHAAGLVTGWIELWNTDVLRVVCKVRLRKLLIENNSKSKRFVGFCYCRIYSG